ncbi:phage head closure protein [Xanthomonas oryzae]|uniref:phage head closure protein n=1 Tax=Xanthomonas oryzae TaxID=347 RepID=UPI0006563283|nr:phage head closure protein [Xanthomonas oryzae]AKO18944.1 head-tail adaptor protein [Xanthomonas oryzae pv. oryzicola]PUE93378.1 head-tail adaptor protein [Xanthomonas oryzae pv. oryzicola]
MRRAGKYRQRIALLAVTTVKDGFGDAVQLWQTWLEEVPAEVVALSGKEFIASGADQAQLTARIAIPYLPGVTSDMRVEHDGQVYTITAVLPDASGRDHLTLMAALPKANG